MFPSPAPASAESTLNVGNVREHVEISQGGEGEHPRGYANESTIARGRSIDQARSEQVDGVHALCASNFDIATPLDNIGNQPAHRDFDEVIPTLEQAARQIPDDHPDRPRCLEHLGIAFESRFDRLGDICDLEEAIARHREAVQLAPSTHPDRARYIVNVGVTLSTRFNCLGDVHDLDEAAAKYEEAVQQTPRDHPACTSRLAGLGTILRKRFHSLGDYADLARSIARLEEAVQLTACDHPDRAGFLDALGVSFGIRFSRLGDVHDINQAILKQEESVKLTSVGDPSRPNRLTDLSMSLRMRFNRLGHLDDLAQAIATQEESVCLTPDHSPDRASGLDNLGKSYGERFNRLGNVVDLEQAVSWLEEAVQLTPDGQPLRADRLVNLGVALRSRFYRLGDVSDLEQSIARIKEAILLTDSHQSDRANALASLGISFATRFTRFNDLRDLNEAISLQEEALHLMPHSHPERPTYLANLGVSLLAHFSRRRDMSSLDQAIARNEEALQFTPPDHPHLALRLANLAFCLGTRFQFLDDVGDLDQAILMLEKAAESTPHDDPDHPSRLFNVGVCLQIRFNRFGDLRDLDQEIVMKEKAIQLTPPDHPEYVTFLTGLGNALQSRYTHICDASDLEQAIMRQEEALQLTPQDHPDLAFRLDKLGKSFGLRFHRIGVVQDIEQAIAKQTQAVQLTPDDHASRANRLHNLGVSFHLRSESLGDQSALNQALHHFSTAARCSTGSPPIRFSAAHQWISCAQLLGDDSLLDAYASAVRILPQLAWIGLTLQNRYEQLYEGAAVVREAVSVALELGHPAMAVEWLEQGRSIVWNEILQLRNPLDELRVEHPTLADKLCQVSGALERASSRHGDQPVLPGSSLETPIPDTSLGEQSKQHRLLAMERDKILTEVRALPGFERFLLGKTIAQLKASAHSGPVVILNASDRRCDALVVRADVDDVLHVPLPGITLVRLEELQITLEKVLRSGLCGPSEPGPSSQDAGAASTVVSEKAPQCGVPGSMENPSGSIEGPDATSTEETQERDLRFEPSLDLLLKDIHIDDADAADTEKLAHPLTSDGAFEHILAALWKDIVKPVLDVLEFTTPGELRRIFWCPTGPFAFLPIHAAGLYDTAEPGSKLSDFAISSYTPTLSALSPTPESNAATHVRVLTVSQPDTDGQTPLPGTREEMAYIKTVIDNAQSPYITLIDSDSTLEDVLSKMTQSEWVHFACHAVQDLRRPDKSGLLLADHRRLTLSDIIKLSPGRPRGGLAFLSACQTATGDKRLSEEAVHLAAGMLLVGYSSVIATMWQVGDRDAPAVARDVYGALIRRDSDADVPDSRRSARALHDAVGRLRERGATFLSWVPFIHIGI